MSCNQCTTKFNFFHKEGGCSSCGLSFCSKCLKQKCRVPGKGLAEHSVCKACFLKLSAGSSCAAAAVSIAPPDAYLKRLEALENPMSPPITMYSRNNNALTSLRAGLSATDLELLDRLEKLKDDGKGLPPTDSELRQRLATLRGENNYVEGPSKQQVFAKDLRSDQEKADSLLEQFLTERDIELAQNPQLEIEARLASLREKGVRPNESSFIKNLHDSGGSSEDEVDKITKKIMDEVALEVRCPVESSSSSSRMVVPPPPAPPSAVLENDVDELQVEELPWCVLCNDDAVVRCLDCGGDLYCKECNKEAHRNWGDTHHKVIPYYKKKQ
ncbi:PREDICTED: abscission/NoCut checkpoint regulator [Nicrophorus vespilloides]|uniref:Abscission/NoCut checkpoint regulator n=1 Tax=Nicrophorus vespilloides TaxID=110193 RepID=A0ABM1M0S6_NICVS|nr:PREDICTED: abscission/NoCut checkpoint regulator [Nicrophorus vespilloides]